MAVAAALAGWGCCARWWPWQSQLRLPAGVVVRGGGHGSRSCACRLGLLCAMVAMAVAAALAGWGCCARWWPWQSQLRLPAGVVVRGGGHGSRSCPCRLGLLCAVVAMAVAAALAGWGCCARWWPWQPQLRLPAGVVVRGGGHCRLGLLCAVVAMAVAAALAGWGCCARWWPWQSQLRLPAGVVVRGGGHGSRSCACRLGLLCAVVAMAVAAALAGWGCCARWWPWQSQLRLPAGVVVRRGGHGSRSCACRVVRGGGHGSRSCACRLGLLCAVVAMAVAAALAGWGCCARWWPWQSQLRLPAGVVVRGGGHGSRSCPCRLGLLCAVVAMAVAAALAGWGCCARWWPWQSQLRLPAGVVVRGGGHASRSCACRLGLLCAVVAMAVAAALAGWGCCARLWPLSAGVVVRGGGHGSRSCACRLGLLCAVVAMAVAAALAGWGCCALRFPAGVVVRGGGHCRLGLLCAVVAMAVAAALAGWGCCARWWPWQSQLRLPAGVVVRGGGHGSRSCACRLGLLCAVVAMRVAAALAGWGCCARWWPWQSQLCLPARVVVRGGGHGSRSFWLV